MDAMDVMDALWVFEFYKCISPLWFLMWPYCTGLFSDFRAMLFYD